MPDSATLQPCTASLAWPATQQAQPALDACFTYSAMDWVRKAESFRMPPLLSRHSVCWPMEEVRPVEVGARAL